MVTASELFVLNVSALNILSFIPSFNAPASVHMSMRVLSLLEYRSFSFFSSQKDIYTKAVESKIGQFLPFCESKMVQVFLFSTRSLFFCKSSFCRENEIFQKD